MARLLRSLLVITIVVSGSMEVVFAHGDEFPLAILVVLGYGIESIVDSSLSCEESGKLLIWDFQYDSNVSVSCRLGLLDYYWVPSSTWLAFLMVDYCALSLGSSLLSEVSRMSSLLDLPLRCGWETPYNDLKPTPLESNKHSAHARTDLISFLLFPEKSRNMKSVGLEPTTYLLWVI